MDDDRPLTAESAGNTTFYLYGLGVIGEEAAAWSYSLPDGTNTSRQLSDLSGEITLSTRYTPCPLRFTSRVLREGDSLELHGTGNFTFGYFGGVLDATTGLLYVGNGQYYDLETGRFLTREVRPNSPNPYVPWNPIGAIVGPLGVIALIFGRRKKGSKAGMLLAVAVVVGSVGMTLAGCGPAPTATPAPPKPQPTSTPDNSAPAIPLGTVTSGGPLTIVTIYPAVTASPIETPTPSPTCTLTSTPTALSIESELELHGVKFDGDLTQWTAERKIAVLEAVRAVHVKLAATVVGATFKAIYEYVNMTWGLKNATGICASIAVGGCTSSRHQINFVTISDDPLRARNNVVHELGHAFSNFWSNSLAEADRAHPENTHPAIVLAWTQGDFPAYTEYIIPGFPNRGDPVRNAEGKYDAGDYLGFFSQQNVLTWQVAITQAGSSTEEFADQFLGWIFDTWQTNSDGTISDFGRLRRDWMDRYMPGWINRILRG